MDVGSLNLIALPCISAYLTDQTYIAGESFAGQYIPYFCEPAFSGYIEGILTLFS